MDERIDALYRRGDVLVNPRTGTRWTLTKKWSYPGSTTWYKFRSDGGRIRDMLPYEFLNWERAPRG